MFSLMTRFHFYFYFLLKMSSTPSTVIYYFQIKVTHPTIVTYTSRGDQISMFTTAVLISLPQIQVYIFIQLYLRTLKTFSTS